MKKLQAPAGSGATCQHEGQTYEIKNGVVELPDNAADALKSHGFTDYVDAPEGEDVDETETTLDRREAAIRMLDKMERPDLILACQQAHIEILKGWNNATLRKKLREAAGIDPPADGVVDLRQAPQHDQLQAKLAGEAAGDTGSEPQPQQQPADGEFGPKVS